MHWRAVVWAVWFMFVEGMELVIVDAEFESLSLVLIAIVIELFALELAICW